MKPTCCALLLASVLAAGLPTSAGAQTPDATLPSQCSDQQVAPASVVLACGDAGMIADGLTWTGWGAAQVTATGTATVKTCDPDCATGGTAQYPITLTASDLRDCSYGEPQYTLVTYAFPAGSPYPPGSPGAEDPTARFPCPTRPHADPKIRAMRMRLTGHNPGAHYYVRVQIKLRVCGVRGRSHVTFDETLGSGKTIFSEHAHTVRFQQVARCPWRTFKWKLRREFFGVGTYRVRATVYDMDTQFSNTVSRRQTTTD